MVESGKSCVCLKYTWIGRGCYSWHPYDANTWDDVKTIQFGDSNTK